MSIFLQHALFLAFSIVVEILTHQCSQATIPAVIRDALHLKPGE